MIQYIDIKRRGYILITSGSLRVKQVKNCKMFDRTTKLLTLLSLTSDQDRISPNTISTISSEQVMRTKKNQFGVIG